MCFRYLAILSPPALPATASDAVSLIKHPQLYDQDKLHAEVLQFAQGLITPEVNASALQLAYYEVVARVTVSAEEVGLPTTYTEDLSPRRHPVASSLYLQTRSVEQLPQTPHTSHVLSAISFTGSPGPWAPRAQLPSTA